MEWKDCCLKLLIVALLFFGIPMHIDKPASEDQHLLFQAFLRKFNKHYKNDTEEYNTRFKNFQTALSRIEELNSMHVSPDGAIYGPTEFSDLSPEEFKLNHLQRGLSQRLLKNTKKRLLAGVPGSKGLLPNLLIKPTSLDKLPAKVDWRVKGAVTPVRSQHLCGACWAFSTIQTVESMLAIKNGTLLTLSVQEAIDCAGNGNLGCNGGDICSLVEWLKDNNIKIETEKAYPLTWQDDVCKLPKTVTGIGVANFSCLTLVDKETEILRTLAFHGPVAVAVNAFSWQYYVGGVIQFHCSGNIFDLNHAVQIVGYDMSSATPYYIVRNSWGSTWGNKGYVYIAIGSNMCGIANDVVALDVS